MHSLGVMLLFGANMSADQCNTIQCARGRALLERALLKEVTTYLTLGCSSLPSQVTLHPTLPFYLLNYRLRLLNEAPHACMHACMHVHVHVHVILSMC